MRDFLKKNFTHIISFCILILIGLSPIFLFTSCDGLPTEPTSSDTCDIASVELVPPNITVTIDDERVIFEAEAYTSDDVLIDPAPTFYFSVNTEEVTITSSGNSVYASPWTPTTSPAEITVTVYDCEGRAYTDKSFMTVNDSPTWLFFKLFSR